MPDQNLKNDVSSPSTTGFSGGVSQTEAFSEKFAALQRWHSIARWQTVGTVVAVAALFGTFAKTTYDEVIGNFSPSANQAAAEHAIATVAPEAVKTLGPALQDVLPIYQKLASDRYPAIRDRVSAATLAHVETLPNETGQIFANSLKSGFERAIKNIEPDLYATFPALADPAQRDVLAVYLHDAIAARNETLAGKLNTITTNEASRIHAVIEKLQVAANNSPRTDKAINDDLVQTLLKLAAQEFQRASNQPQTGNLPSASIVEP